MNLPIIDQINDPATGRYYQVTDGDKYYPKLLSVSRIVNHYRSSKALNDWRTKLGNEEADRYTEDSQLRGTMGHGFIEDYLLKRKMPSSVHQDLDGYECFLGMLAILPLILPIQIESKTYWVNSQSRGFGGTMDIFGAIDGNRLIIKDTGNPICDGEFLFVGDWKTWKKDKPKYQRVNSIHGGTYYPLLSYFLQCSAYCMALNQRKGFEACNQVLLIGVTPNCLSPFIYYLDPTTVAYYQEKMAEIIDCYYADKPFYWLQFGFDSDINGMLGQRCKLRKDKKIAKKSSKKTIV